MDPITMWGAWMRLGGSATSTVLTRTRHLRALEREYGRLLTLTHKELAHWLARFDHATTRSTYLSYIRCFYAWAVAEGLMEEDPTARLPKVKTPTGVPRPAPTEDVTQAIAAAPPRERAWLLLMAYAGLRCCEVALHRPGDVWRSDDGSWWLRVPHSKGGHDQQVPVPGWVAAELLAAPAWSVSAQTVQRGTREVLRSVGSAATPHQVRHWYATAALRSTGNLRVVQQMMRHATPATTARYTLVASTEATAAAEGLPRLAST